MHKIVTLAAAGTLALAISLSATARSEAFFPGLALLGLAAVATTAAVASDDPWYHGGYWGGPGWDDHAAACADAYRSYDRGTDTYVRKVNGRLVRVYCDL